MIPAPQFPIYIPSKSRAKRATTPRVLASMGLDYRIIVEEPQLDEYTQYHDPAKLLVLDPEFQRTYDTCDDVGEAKSKGPGPARNFAWAHAIAEGHPWHWVMDDNIEHFARLHQNQRIPVGDGMIFAAMEEFCLRYRNIGQAGPEYWMFVPSRVAQPPFVLNTRIFSCNLIRNDVPVRWRGRYNEDLDLSLTMLKAGWCTVSFRAFLQKKMPTQLIGGGNTEAFYATEGTTLKSEMAVRLHPDCCKMVTRYGRVHHDCDFSRWKNVQLVPRDDAPPPDPNRYRSRRVARVGEQGVISGRRKN